MYVKKRLSLLIPVLARVSSDNALAGVSITTYEPHTQSIPGQSHLLYAVSSGRPDQEC